MSMQKTKKNTKLNHIKQLRIIRAVLSVLKAAWVLARRASAPEAAISSRGGSSSSVAARHVFQHDAGTPVPGDPLDALDWDLLLGRVRDEVTPQRMPAELALDAARGGPPAQNSRDVPRHRADSPSSTRANRSSEKIGPEAPTTSSQRSSTATAHRSAAAAGNRGTTVPAPSCADRSSRRRSTHVAPLRRKPQLLNIERHELAPPKFTSIPQ